MLSHEDRALAAGNQLELWSAPGVDAAEGLRVVRKDGRETEFDLRALSNSILRAGWPGEALDGDTAESLARAVHLFLQHSDAQAVSVAMLRETVERLLIDMGYTLTARMYAGAFAPASQMAPGGAGMFDEALAIDRAERMLAAAASDAGLERAAAEEIVASVLRQINTAGMQRLTPGLLREWMRSELHTRGLGEAAGRIARLTLPVSALHDAFAEPEAAPVAPADPESAALALAGRVSAAYVLGQLMPAAVGQAHLRGEIQVRGVGNFVRLDSILLDLEDVKEYGPLGQGGAAPRADSPEGLAGQLAAQTATLARYFGGEISWKAINFGFAPMIAGRSDEDLRAIISAFLCESFERARGAHAEIRLAWDAPEDFTAETFGSSGDRMTLADTYAAARRFLGAALDVLVDVSEKGWPQPRCRTALHLSPYFFGMPEANDYLERIGRIAGGGLPIVLRYEPAESMMLDAVASPQRTQITAQTVSISATRAAKLGRGLDGFLARLDTAFDAATAAHRTKREFIERIARDRSGPLALLRKNRGAAPFVNLDAMQYRVAVGGLDSAALARAGVSWIAPGEEAAIAELALLHLRESCGRWTAATGQALALADEDAIRLSGREVTASHHGIGRLFDTVARDGQLHPLFDTPPFFRVSGEAFAGPNEIGAFIRHAFLHTSCRALLFI